MPDPLKVPLGEGVPDPDGVTEAVAEGVSVIYEELDGEEVLTDSAVTIGDGLALSEELNTDDAEAITLADSDTPPEGEEVAEPPSDTVIKADRVAVEKASDGLAIVVADTEGELLTESAELYDTADV